MRIFNAVVFVVINLVFNNSVASNFRAHKGDLPISKMQAISEALGNASLEGLSLISCSIKSHNAQELSQAIKNNPSLVGLQALYLESCDFDENIGRELFCAIKQNTSLTSLSLKENTDFAAGKDIPILLANKQALTSLWLGNKFENKKEFQQFALCLGAFDALEYLDLPFCHLPYNELILLLAAVDKSKALRTIVFGNYSHSDESSRALINFIGSHRKNCCRISVASHMNEKLAPTLEKINKIDRRLAYFAFEESIFEIMLVFFSKKNNFPPELSNIILDLFVAKYFYGLNESRLTTYFGLLEDRQQLIEKAMQ